MAGDTLAQLDPLYFLDYALFTGSVRHYASRILEEAFKADPNPARRRLHLVNLVKEEYAAYEDAGAILNALLDYRRGKVAVPFASLMAFRPGDVELSTMFQGQKVASGDDLYAALAIDEWVPGQWTEWFPHLDLRKGESPPFIRADLIEQVLSGSRRFPSGRTRRGVGRMLLVPTGGPLIRLPHP